MERGVTRWIKYANLVGSRNWDVREAYAANGRQQGNYLSWRHAIRRSSTTWLLSHCSKRGWARIRFPSEDQLRNIGLATSLWRTSIGFNIYIFSIRPRLQELKLTHGYCDLVVRYCNSYVIFYSVNDDIVQGGKNKNNFLLKLFYYKVLDGSDV